MHRGAPRGRSGSFALLVTLLLHAALVWLLARSAAPHDAQTVAPRRITLRMIPTPWVEPTPQRREPAARAMNRSMPVRTIVPTRPIRRTVESVDPPQLEALSRAEPAASAPSRPPSLIDTEATRRAIRASARMPSLTDEAARVAEQPRRAGPQEQLGTAVRSAGKGDCLKGQFAGAGMGLLSLPFFVLAKARGDCAP